MLSGAASLRSCLGRRALLRLGVGAGTSSARLSTGGGPCRNDDRDHTRSRHIRGLAGESGYRLAALPFAMPVGCSGGLYVRHKLQRRHMQINSNSNNAAATAEAHDKEEEMYEYGGKLYTKEQLQRVMELELESLKKENPMQDPKAATPAASVSPSSVSTVKLMYQLEQHLDNVVRTQKELEKKQQSARSDEEEEKREEEEEDVVEDAIILNSTDPDVHLEYAYSHLEQGKYDRAIAAYTRAIALDDKRSDAFLERGSAYINKSQTLEAPATVTTRLPKALTQHRLLLLAIKDFNRTIEQHPSDYRAYFNRGLAYKHLYAIGSIDQSVVTSNATTSSTSSTSSTVSTTTTTNPPLPSSDGESSVSSMTTTTATATASETIEPGDDTQLGKVAVQTNDISGDYFDNAVADFTKATKLNPKDADAFFQRGLLYSGEEEHLLAITDFTNAIDITRAQLIDAMQFEEKVRLRNQDQGISPSPATQQLSSTTTPVSVDAQQQQATSNADEVPPAQFSDQSIRNALQMLTDQTNLPVKRRLILFYHHRGREYQSMDETDKATADFQHAEAINSELPADDAPPTP